jgi:hypothetical protein
LATIAQIIAFADRYFPNDVSDANKILDLDHLHKEIYNKLKHLKYDYEMDSSSTTIAGQLAYSKPTNADFDQIFLIKVSNDLAANIDENTDWDTYEYADLKSSISSGTYWGRASSSTFALIKDGLPIDTSGYEIRVFYYKQPTSITATTDTPTLEAQYHNLLIYGLIQMLASQGHNPDTEVADYWQRKFDEEFLWVRRNIEEKDIVGVDTEQLEGRW